MPDKNFQRKLSATQIDPGPTNRPKLDEISGRPYFDRRYLAWRIRNPDHPLADDLDYVNRGRWPRQQADQSCNLLQLYEHIEYYLVEFQTRYGHYKGNSRILMMPYQVITPKAGWKLYDYDTDQVYTVKEVLVSHDRQKRSVFDGRILLSETSGPPEGHKLRWIDPYGEADEQQKLIKVLHSEEVRPLVETRASSGDVSDVKSAEFYPVISYRLDRREPASISNHAFGPARELKHRIRMIVRDPDNPNIFQKIWGQWYDNLIEFKVHALGPKIADYIAQWLEIFFLMYNRALMQLGVQQVLPWDHDGDKEEIRTVHDLSVRRLSYYFRLEDLMVELESKISSYSMKFQSLEFSDTVPWFTSEQISESFPTDTSGDYPLYGGPDIGDDF